MGKAVRCGDIERAVLGLGLDGVLGRRVWGSCRRIFDATSHVHGLTKNSRPLLRVTATLCDARAVSQAFLTEMFPGLSLRERGIVLDALRLVRGKKPHGEAHAVSVRIAAIVGSGEMEIVGVWDTGVGGAGVDADAGIEAGGSVGEAAQFVLWRQLKELDSRVYGLGDGEDIEYVHEMRVALRRIRAALRVFRKVLGSAGGEVRAESKRLADALGGVRDIDVFTKFLKGYAAKVPEEHSGFLRRLMRAEGARRRKRYKELEEAFSLERYGHFKEEFYAMLAEAGAGGEVSAAAQRAIGKRVKKTARYTGRVDRYSSRRQHALRIECKWLRYTAEFFAGIYRGGLREIVEPMRRMQGLLGDVHDAQVYRQRVSGYHVRSRRKGEDETGAAAGLAGHLARRQERSARKAAALWKEFCGKKARRKLRKIIENPGRG